MSKAKRKNTIDAMELVGALKVALKCTSIDQTRIGLTGVLFEAGKGIGGKEGLTMIGTNGRCLYGQTIEIENVGTWPKTDVVVNADDVAKMIKGVGKIKTAGTKAIITDTRKTSVSVLLTGTEQSFILERIDAHYPDWRQVIPDVKKYKNRVLVDRKGLIDALKVVVAATTEKYSQVELSFEKKWVDCKEEKAGKDGKGELVLTINNEHVVIDRMTNCGSYKAIARIRAELEGDEVDVSIRPQYLLDVLVAMSHRRVAINVAPYKELKAIMLWSGNYSAYVQMPMKR